MEGPINGLLTCFPELKYYLNDIHVVYASSHSNHNITYRPTLEVVNEIREARKNGKKKIIFFNGSEGFWHSITETAMHISEILDEIPKKDLILIVGVVNANETYEKFCKKTGSESRFTVIGCHWFEEVIYTYAKHQPTLDIEYEIKPKEKLFVCFNKVARTHRINLLVKAIENNWLDKSFYSFEGDSPEWLDRLSLREDFSKYILSTLNSIKEKFPLRLNITDERENPVDIVFDDLIYHQESYFSIITETIFFNAEVDKFINYRPLMDYIDGLFLSEKIYKPFAFKHPFIAFAHAGVLKVLKDRGFKTFHPYINESYDDETDDLKRFDMLIDEIKRLEKFTIDDWLKWQRNIKPIVEYNYKYLLSLTSHRDGPMIDYIFEN